MRTPPVLLSVALVAGACHRREADADPQIAGSGRSSTIAVDLVHGEIWVADRDLPQVSVLSTDGFVLAQIALADDASALAISPNGRLVAVAGGRNGLTTIIDRETREITGTVGVGGACRAVVFTDPHTAYVAIYDSADVAAIDVDHFEILQSWHIGYDEDAAPNEEPNDSRGWDPSALAWDDDRHTLYVGHYQNQRITTIDTESGEVTAAAFLARVDDGGDQPQGLGYRLESIALLGDDTLLAAHVTWNEDEVTRPGRSIFPALSAVDRDTLIEGPRRTGWSGMADPQAVIGLPDLRIGLVAQGTSELMIIDPDGTEHRLQLPGRAPDGIAISPSGRTAWIKQHLTRDVVEVDLGEIGDDPELIRATPFLYDDPHADLLPAWDLFTSARAATSSDGVTTCASCHPHGIDKTVRWFLGDSRLDTARDARMGHRYIVGGFASSDRLEARADLVRLFADQGGLADIDPTAPPAELVPALDALEAWLHGPDNLPFRGSWVSTSDGGVLDPALFEADCESCHATISAEFEQSVHRHSGLDDEIYVGVEDAMVDEIGTSMATMCVGCHVPEAVVTGSATIHDGPMPEDRRRGMSCLSCHGTGRRVSDGNNPSVFDPERATEPDPVTDVDTHAGRMFVGGASFCSGCHQAFMPGTGTIEFFTYQEFLATPLRGVTECEDCHMPDRGGHSDHRFVGPSAWQNQRWGGAEKLADGLALLRSALDVEIDGVVAPGGPQALTITVEDVGAGHLVPTGVANLRDVWVEIVAVADGVEVFRSEGPEPDGRIPDVLRIGKRIWDAEGARLDRHEVWRMARTQDRGVSMIAPRTLRIDFDSPSDATALQIDAIVWYRSLPPDLVEATPGLPELEVPPDLPIEIARTTVTVGGT